MVATDAGRALLLGAAAVAGLLGRLGLPGLLVVAFAVGALSVFFDVAYQASVVGLVRRDQLLRGGSVGGSGQRLSTVLDSTQRSQGPKMSMRTDNAAG